MPADRSYHHGDLRQTLLDEALRATAEVGPTGWSLRELARRAGVSHAASSRHFADKQALMTAMARDGWHKLADEMEAAAGDRHPLYDVGRAYMRFATEDVAYFEILNRPDLYDGDDPEVASDRARVFAQLHAGSAALGEADPLAAGTAAWALVHGLAALHNHGMLDPALGAPVEVFRTASRYMFPGR